MQQRFLIQYLYNVVGDSADLWSEDMDEEEQQEQVQARTVWSFDGKEVCFPAFVKLLGSSKRSICQRCKGFVPLPREHKPQVPVQTHAIDEFWLNYWHSNAEPLPLDGWSAKESFKEARPDFMLPLDEGSQGFEEGSIEDWAIGSSAPDLLSRIGQMDALRRLPQRYLPHARLTDYYWEFVAQSLQQAQEGQCEPEESSGEEPAPPWEPVTEHGNAADAGVSGHEPPPEPPMAAMGSQEPQGITKKQGIQESEGKHGKPPSWATFYRRWRSVWRHVLRIRKSSQHAECSICFKFRQQLRNTRKSLDKKLEIAHEWRHHLYWQYCDRCVYWSLRWASRRRDDVLVLIIDALDRSKFMLPKYDFHRKSSILDNLLRPRVIITGGIAHGYCRHAFVTSEEHIKGGSSFLEMLTIMIEQVYKIRGGNLPSHLVVVADNTVAQAKNSEVNLCLAALVARCHFQSSNLLFLTEGHTHEDIGQH